MATQPQLFQDGPAAEELPALAIPPASWPPDLELSWVGAPAVKKNSQEVIFPWLFKQGYRKGFVSWLYRMATIAQADPRAASQTLTEAAAKLRPIIVPGGKFQTYERAAVRQITRAHWSKRDEAFGGKKCPVEMRVIYYLAARQQPDLNNLNAAVADILQKLGVLSNDYFLLRPHPDTRRVRDKDDPRTEVALWKRPDIRFEF